MLNSFFSTMILSPFFGISLSIISFRIGIILSQKLKTPFANPLLIAMILCMSFLKVFGISYADYNRGGEIIFMFLGPATAVLAVSVYRQFELLKKNLLPILAGTIVGSAVSLGAIMLMCRLFSLDKAIAASVLPKSVTTPIAISLSEQGGGIPAVTISAVVLTGLFGSVTAPSMSRLFRITNPAALGLAMGTSSHALGTSRAMQMGEVEGAMAGLALALAGFVTVLFYAIFPIV